MIFFLTGNIFTGMFITTPNNNTVLADTQVWENEYGKLEVEPATSTNIIRQKQYYNLTWYYPDNTIDIAFGFNDSLSYGKVFYWDGDSYNKINVNHIEYNDKHFYVLNNINVVQDNTYHGYWEYDTPINSNGKWDMYAKLSSDSWNVAFSSGRIVHLDPWWNSSWNHYVALRTDSSQIVSTLTDFPILVNSTNATLIGRCMANGEDIRFVNDANSTEFFYEIEEWTPSGFTIWVNMPNLDSNGENINMYYGNAFATSNQTPSSVWDANFLGVYHMNSSTTTTKGCYDSTVNANHGTYVGGNLPKNIGSPIGGAQDFVGGDTISLPAGCWLDCTDGNNLGTITSYYDIGNPTNSQLYYQGSTSTAFIISRAREATKATARGYDGAAVQWGFSSNTVMGADYWMMYSVSMYKDDVDLFINGSVDSTDASCNMLTDNVDTMNTIAIGQDNFPGNMTEFRISDIARSDDWIITTYNTMNNATTFVTFAGDEQTGPGVTDPITGLTSVTMGLDNITLDWTKSIDGNFTHIEYNTVSSWTRGDGTLIYNASGVNHSEYNLTARTQYYFSAWAFNESTHNFSSAATTNNDTGPGIVTGISTTVSSGYLSFTWNKNSRGDHTVIMRKENSYPTVVGDGTEIYNSTASSYNDAGFTTSMYYTLYAHNTTNHLSSLGNKVEWGALEIRVYDENTSESIYNYTIHITNQSGSETYEKYSDGNQTITIELSDMPTGEDIIIRINASVYINATITTEYDDRIYYYDIVPNTFYNITAYLSPSTISNLYYIRVINEFDEPIKDVSVKVKRYINETSGYDTITSELTDANGYVNVYLEPDIIYKVTITKANYDTAIGTYIPDPDYYGINYPKEFMILATVIEPVIKTFGELCDLSGSWASNKSLYVTFTDLFGETTNIQFKIYESYNGTRILNETYNYVAESNISFYVEGLNSTRAHDIVICHNHTTLGFTKDYTITVLPLKDYEIEEEYIEDKITAAIGEFDLGYTKFFLIWIPAILILLGFAAVKLPGVGIIGSGLWCIGSSWYLKLTSDQLVTNLGILFALLLLLGILALIAGHKRRVG